MTEQTEKVATGAEAPLPSGEGRARQGHRAAPLRGELSTAAALFWGFTCVAAMLAVWFVGQTPATGAVISAAFFGLAALVPPFLDDSTAT